MLDISRNGLTRRGVNALKAVGISVRAETQQSREALEGLQYLSEGGIGESWLG